MKKWILTMLLAGLCALPLAACNKNVTASVPPEPEQNEAVLPEPPEDIPAEVIPVEPPMAEYIRVLTDGLNIRTGAGTSYSSLGTVEKGVLLSLDGTEDGWYKTSYRGRTAYISASSAYTATARLEMADARIERVIEEGLTLLGTPYVYGATRFHDGKGAKIKGFTTDKFDCSSLMQYIFYQGAGVLLDTTTRTQIMQGVPVAGNDLQRGDLLFFTNASRYYNTGIERVGHVALYLGGNYILHTASDYAKIEQISTQRWNYFLGARRVL